MVNNIASAYEKKQIFPLLENSDWNSNIFTKNNEDIHTLLSNRLQLPDAIADDTLIDYSLSHSESDVNTSDENNSGKLLFSCYYSGIRLTAVKMPSSFRSDGIFTTLGD